MASVTMLNTMGVAGLLGTDPVNFATNQLSTTIIQGLTATLSADQSVWVGGIPLTFTVQIDNNSGEDLTVATMTTNLDLSLVTFDDTFGVDIDGGTGVYTLSGDLLTITLIDILDTDSSTITFRVNKV